MKIVTTKTQLILALSKVQKAVAVKSTLPILEGILFNAQNGKLSLISFDLEMGIETFINVDVIIPGKMVVSSKLIGEIVRKLPDGDVVLTVDEKNVINIECEHSTMNINGFNPDEFPSLPEIEKEKSITIKSSELKEIIKQTIFAKSEDEIRPILTGVLFQIEENKLTLIALDGFRMAVKKCICESNNNEKIVIPGKTLNELVKIIEESDEIIKIYYSKNKVMFEVDETILISRLLEGEFVNYNQLIPVSFGVTIEIDRNNLLDSCDRASLISKENKNNMVKFDIDNENLKINSNSDNGNFNENIKIRKEGENLEIAFNSKYLTDALKMMKGKEILMKYTTNVSPAIMVNKDNDDFIYLVLPVRISK